MSRRKKCTDRQKQEILKLLSEGNHSVLELRKIYGVSKSALYRWASGQKTIADSKEAMINNLSNLSNNFVEVAVKDEEAVGDLDKLDLQKASLIFKNFSLSLEGRISSRKLVSILRIL